MAAATPQTYPRHSYHTLAREKQFRAPAVKGSDVPILNEFVAPHIESFNALFDDSGLPQGDGDGRGLLSIGVADIGARVVFDGKGQLGVPSDQGGWGNRLTCEHFFFFVVVMCHASQLLPVWIDSVSIGRPMVPEKDKEAVERRVFPSEVHTHFPLYFVSINAV